MAKERMRQGKAESIWGLLMGKKQKTAWGGDTGYSEVSPHKILRVPNVLSSQHYKNWTTVFLGRG